MAYGHPTPSSPQVAGYVAVDEPIRDDGARMRSVKSTFRILETVADQQPIGLSALSRLLEMPKSTVQRSLATLAELGWIRPDGGESGRWVLGDRVRSLSGKVDDVGWLREAALPAMERLNTETLETIHLAVLETRTVRLVERMDSQHALRLVRPIGTRNPLHAGSTGRSVLANLPEAEIDAYIAGGLSALTSRTITDPDRLRDNLKSVRERGYAIANEDLIDGIVSVAACIRAAPHGRPIAAMSISAASVRMSDELCATNGQRVVEAAAEVTARIAASSTARSATARSD
jgi:IclR family acetate operon transcriptional repressor